MLRNVVIESVKRAVKKAFGIEDINSPVEYPRVKSAGDYTSTVAMTLARMLKTNPKSIAEKISDELKNDGRFEKVETAGAGYINLSFSKEFLFSILKSAVDDPERFGSSNTGNGKKVILEFVSANPTGPLHIGHARWAAIGDSIARAMRKSGFNVFTEFYINDAGRQVKLFRESVEAVRSGKQIPEDGYHGKYIEEIAQMEGDPVEIMKEQHRKDLEDFRVVFDSWFSEKKLRDDGKVEEAMKFLEEKGLTYEKDGAKWFKSTEFGDDKDRVLVKSDGEYTYFAVDIAYHKTKIDRGFEEIIDVFGADHHGYVGRLNAAVKAIAGNDVKLRIVIGQLVSLYRAGEPVRMSKRTGDIITLREVMDEIGVDAMRYHLVSRKTDTHLDFDLAEAVKQSEDNPVYYLQYASARMSGIMRTAEERNAFVNQELLSPDVLFEDEGARELAVLVSRLSDEISDVALSLEPHRLTIYLNQLATSFHKYYTLNRVITPDKVKTSNRLFLVKAVRTALKSGLEIIGVEAPERM